MLILHERSGPRSVSDLFSVKRIKPRLLIHSFFTCHVSMLGCLHIGPWLSEFSDVAALSCLRFFRCSFIDVLCTPIVVSEINSLTWLTVFQDVSLAKPGDSFKP